MLDWIWGWGSKFCLELLYGFGLCVLFITSGTSEFICLFIEIEPPQQPDLMHCARKNSFLTGRTLDRERGLRYLKQQEATLFLFVCSLLSSARVYHFLDFGISPFGSSSLASRPVVPCPELGDEFAPTNSLLVTARCRNICFYRFHPISSVWLKHHRLPLILIPVQFSAKLRPLILGKQLFYRYTCYPDMLYNMLTVKRLSFAFGCRFMISTAHKFDLWGPFMLFYEWHTASTRTATSRNPAESRWN